MAIREHGADRRLSELANAGASSAAELQLILLDLGSERCAIEISVVREIAPLSRITFVPGAPPGVLGIVNLRGQIVPVFDLGLRCGISPSRQDATSRIVVVDREGSAVGVLVDRVSEIARVREDEIELPETLGRRRRRRCVRGVAKLGQGQVLVLDLAEALSAEPSRAAPGRRKRVA